MNGDLFNGWPEDGEPVKETVMSDLPICECANYYGTGKHHPECPVRNEIERLKADLKTLAEGNIKRWEDSCAMANEIERLKAELKQANAVLREYGWHVSGKCQLLNPKPDGTTTWVPKCTCGFTAALETDDE